jgi:hypothetical protein
MSDDVRIELDESSGPVSPKFQYSLQVEIADGSIKIRRKTQKGLVELTHALDATKLSALVVELQKRVPTSVDLIGEMRKRVGISFNHLSIASGGTTARVDYLLSHAEDGAHAELTAAIDAIKALVTEAEASQDPSTAR